MEGKNSTAVSQINSQSQAKAGPSNSQTLNMEKATIHDSIVGTQGNVTVINNFAPSNQSSGKPTESCSDNHLQEAVNLIQQHQLEKLESNLVLHGLTVDESKIPKVYQSLAESDIYEVEDPPIREPFYPSTKGQGIQKFKTFKAIDFNKMLVTMMGVGFLALVGPPGCGKTLLAKRLAKFTNYFVIFLRFMDLGYETVLTPQELLIDYPFKDVDQTTRENAFQWMVKNQEKCVFVLDGYDQWSLSLSNERRADMSNEKPSPIQQLVANLCFKNLFQKSLLIFTSRPHAILSIPLHLRPNRTVVVGDLPPDGMRELFNAFAGDQAENLWTTWNSNAPQLIQLCHNPLLLQLVVYAGLSGNVDQLNTITNVFLQFLQQLENSVHKKGLKFHALIQPLGGMAYDGMDRQTVVFTSDDLEKTGLDDVNVQDFVIKVASWTSLFEGDQATFYFIHQSLQEMFAAMYICMKMPDSEFNNIIHQVVYESHWSMVRRFMCGLLLGGDPKQGKSEKLRTQLTEFMKRDL